MEKIFSKQVTFVISTNSGNTQKNNINKISLKNLIFFVLYLYVKDAEQPVVENYEQYYEEEDDINVYKEKVCHSTVVCITIF